MLGAALGYDAQCVRVVTSIVKPTKVQIKEETDEGTIMISPKNDYNEYDTRDPKKVILSNVQIKKDISSSRNNDEGVSLESESESEEEIVPKKVESKP